MEFNHKSVMLYETVDALNVKPDGIYLDGTLGGAGHSFEICSRLSEKGRLIGIDRDEYALGKAKERLAKMKEAGRRRGLICTRERRTAMETKDMDLLFSCWQEIERVEIVP